MLKKLAVLLVTICTAFALLGCEGRSGSSGVLPTDDPGGTTTTTVKTKVALTYALARAPVSPLAVDPVEAAYQSAVVTLTLPDGRAFTMTYNGNGEYSCIVTNLPDGVAGYIEADINQMVLKSFFDNLFAKQEVLDAGEVGADSTFAADVLSSFAQALSGSQLDPSAILAGVSGATLNIDIQSLNAQTTDGSIVDYELARRAYANVLTWGNIDLTSGEITGLIDGNPSVQNLREAIADGVVVPPAQGGPVDEAKAFALGLLDAYYNTRTSAALLPYLSTSNFLWAGLDRAGFSGRASSEWSSEPVFVTSTSADFTNTIVSVSPAADFTGTGLTMWVVTLEGTFDLTLTDSAVVTRSFGGPLKRFYAANVGGAWVAFGDRKKMVFDYQIGYFNSNDPGRFTEISVTATAGGDMPVTVEMGLPNYEGTYPVYSSESEPSKFSFLLSGGPSVNWSYDSFGWTSDAGYSYAGLDGEVLTVTATFDDNSTALFQKVVEIQSPTTVVTYFSQNQDGSLWLEWRPPTVGERLLRVEVRLPRHGLSYSLPPTARELTLPEADLTAAGVVPYEPDYLDVIYFTPTAQYGYREFFTPVLPVSNVRER